MKLAEALLLRADLQKKIVSLRLRLTRAALVQQGERPVEDPANLLTKLEGALKEFETVLFKINQANLEQRLADGRSVTAGLARRDALVAHHGAVAALIAAATKAPERYSTREIPWVVTVDVAQLQVKLEDLGRQLLELNAAIQAANWRIEIEW